jgi:hypothetical protein
VCRRRDRSRRAEQSRRRCQPFPPGTTAPISCLSSREMAARGLVGMTSTAGLGLANLLVAGAGFRPPPTSCGRAIWSYERRPSTATTSSGSSRLGATFAWRSIRSFHLLPDRGRAGATGRAERVHRSDDDRLPLLQRAHRRCRVGALRAPRSLHPGPTGNHRGGAPHPAAARGAAVSAPIRPEGDRPPPPTPRGAYR